ncbi:hypothetical protein [Halorubrum distributum]|uniref:hypothetical protein n=1 Tax=Halorubrum distributum TaxID=29283 RepID=UPI000A3FC501|nr:hypothetical protein [Halorubrum litoreum]
MVEAATKTAACPDWRCPNDDLEEVGDSEPDGDYYCWMCRVLYSAEEVMIDE